MGPRMGDCEQDPTATREVVLTSWDCNMTDCEQLSLFGRGSLNIQSEILENPKLW